MTWILALLWTLMFETEGDPDDDTPTDDTPTDEDEEDDDDEIRNPATDEEKIQNTRIRELSHEAGRWRKKYRAAQERLIELENNSLAPSLKASRVEAAFWRAVATGEHRIGDVESALDLFLARGFVDLVKVGTAKDDPSIEGMDVAMEKLVARYPWLADGDGPSDADVELPARRTASPPRKKRDTGVGPDRKAMESRLPALRRHSRG